MKTKSGFIKGTEILVPAISKEEIIDIVKTKKTEFEGKGFCFEGKIITFKFVNELFICSFDEPIPEWYIKEIYEKIN